MSKIDTVYERVGFWAPKVAIVSLLALVLAGCGQVNTGGSTPSPNSPPVAGTELDVTINSADVTIDIDTKQNVVVETGNRILVTTAGSGSCPPLVESVYIDGDTIKLFTKQYYDQPCTMDYRMYSQQVTHVNESNIFENKEFLLCASEKECFVLPQSNMWDAKEA